MMTARTVQATQALVPSAESAAVLTVEQVDSWKSAGFCLVNGVLPQDLVELVQNNCAHPPVLEGESGIGLKDNGFNGLLFPCLDAQHACLNEVTLHARVITACSQLLSCAPSELRLSQSELWSKFNTAASTEGSAPASAGTTVTADSASSSSSSPFDTSGSQDQRVHIDGFNHYLTFPTEWDKPEAVAIIVYYDDTNECGGGTAVVPRMGEDDPAYHGQPGAESPLMWTPGGRSDLPWLNDRCTAEDYLQKTHPEVHAFRQQLYDRERYVRAVPGTILFYRLDIWHRGVPLFPGGKRRVQNMIYKRHGTDWLNSWNAGSARNMYTKAQTVERIIAKSTMHQRCVLGFPKPDSEYWTPYTLAATKARYKHLESGLLHMEEVEQIIQKKQQKSRVFVYGTLLKGLENHKLLKDEKLLTAGRTVEELYMVSNLTYQRQFASDSEKAAGTYEPTYFEPQDKYPYPFLMRKPITAGHVKTRISGEVYQVSPETLLRLDILEDHPNSYFRESIPIELSDGSIENVNIYMLKSEQIFADISVDIVSKSKDPNAASYYAMVDPAHSGSWHSYISTLK